MTSDQWLHDWGLYQWGTLASLTIGVLVGLAVYLRVRARSETTPPPSKKEEAAPASLESSHVPLSSSSFYHYRGDAEKRIAPRRKGNPLAVVIRKGEEKENYCHGLVLDRSVGGLCLEVERHIAAGALLFVRPVDAPPTSPSIQMEVKNSRENGNRWVLGCAYIKPPTAADIMHFG